MNREQAAKDLLYPSVKLQLVEPISHPGDEENEQGLEATTVQEIVCPKCGSRECWKRGNREGGRKEYSCKECKKFFIIHPLVDKDGREIKCPDCKSRGYNLHGKDANSKQIYKCKDCVRQYVLNPYGRDELDHLNNINCRWCNSKNFGRASLSKSGKQQCICKDCHKQFTVGAERPDVLIAPEKFDFDHDVWTAEHLGYENGIHKHNKLNFEYIEQPWLKQYFKKFILYLASTRLAFGTLNGKVHCINIFSRFLKETSYYQEFEGINRALIIDYLSYLKIHKYSDSTYTHCISTVKTFFETGTFNFWFNVEPALIRPEDWLRLKKGLPRFIPEEVMKQLSQHIDGLPEPVMRMALVDIECGFRIGELTRLAIDCLKSNGKGGWYIQYYMSKMKKDCSKPISIELAKVIQEQQSYIKEVLGKDFTYLFCGRARGKSEEFIPEPKLMTSTSFVEHIKRLARKHEIKDSLGKLWNFQTHQFRHTVGTRMINAGVPQHIVQKYLGHECPQMTMRYAHIHDVTLRKEIEKYHESTPVNFQGEAVELEETILSSSNDLEWFTKNVQPRALEHGYCGRPRLLGDCDIPGFDGCYNCPHWRTNKSFLPILQDTLDRTNKVLEKARMAGWELQVKKNEPIKHNLEKVIKSLEADSHE
jgi:integrase/recombinase XerD